MLNRLLKSLVGRRENSKADDLLPPKKLQRSIGGSYKEVGDEFLRHLQDLCGLQPDDAVLDVGCGSGRVAVALTRYLSDKGMYRGFDVMVNCVEWCRDNITPRFPNFQFEVADIENGNYNPKGKYKSSEYRFAYPDRTFDVVFLTSVFTHLLPADMKQYIAEIGRVLKPGGRCLATFFLLNDESVGLMGTKGTFNFKYQGPGYHSSDPDTPEKAVAYPEDLIRKLFEDNGMRVEQPIRFGSWSGRSRFLSFQDIVISSKLG